MKKSVKVLVDFARRQLQNDAKHMDNHNYHFGINFLSDKLVQDKINKGKSIMQALQELAEDDFNSL